MATDIEQAAGAVVERFATSSGRVLGFVTAGAGLLISAGVLLTDPSTNWGLLLFGLIMALLAYVVLIRPVVVAHQNGVVLRNMLHDTFVPWTCIERARVLQTLQVVTDDETFHGFGMTQSARSMAKSNRSRLRSAGTSGFGAGGFFAGGGADVAPIAEGASYQTYVESRLGDLAANAHDTSKEEKPLVTWAMLPVVGAATAAALLVAILLF